MIYYFTGTGNSLYVAKVLGINLEMSIHDLSENFRHPIGESRLILLTGKSWDLFFLYMHGDLRNGYWTLLKE